ncbi:MAG: hypothetical protein R3298_01300 [Gammaproteobacteria bacterium]|nr:hypothetical protein [Gammaproteobacteria bacterium]
MPSEHQEPPRARSGDAAGTGFPKRLFGILPMLLVAALLLTLATPFPERNAAYLDAAAERALASFAIARGLNGVISVIQETEVGFSLGVRGSLEPGQVLDPLNDLVERFSLVALAAATLLWSLKLLGAFVVTPWPLVAALALWLVGDLFVRRDRWGSREIGRLAHRLLRVFAVVWLFAAVTPVLIETVHTSRTVGDVYATAIGNLDSAGSALADLGRYDGLPTPEALRGRVARVAGLADAISRDAVAVLAVYLFEVVLLPLFVFWLGARLLPATWVGERSPST